MNKDRPKNDDCVPQYLYPVAPNTIAYLETILDSVGHDPGAAAAGWRSEDPFVVALLFASIGCPVFPCGKFKQPLTVHGFKDATTNFYSLSYWARTKPVAGWCVRTGRYAGGGGVSGLWYFDIDDAAGYARLAELEAEVGPLPQTWTCMSGRPGSGEHRIFLPGIDGPDMKTLGKALIAGKRGNIDQKGRGGYAVIAGSYHKSGRRYHWGKGCAPDETPLATLPACWVEAMDKAGEASATSTIRPRKNRTPREKREHAKSLLVGDGPGYGGFNDPLYRNAIQYFFQAGVEAPTEPLVDALRDIITDAPKDPGRDVSRYMEGSDLPRLVDRAREYVQKVKDSDVEYQE